MTTEIDTIVKRVSQKMLEKELSQSALAEKAGIAQPTLSLFLREKRSPSVDLLVRLAPILGVSVDYLVGNTDSSEAKAMVEHAWAQNLLADYSKLTPRDQERVLDLIRALKPSDVKAKQNGQ